MRAVRAFLVLLLVTSPGSLFAEVARADELAAAREAAAACRARVMELLASDDARLQAWGATYAAVLPGAANDEPLGKALIEVVRARGRLDGTPDRAATKAALDALVRIPARVPVAAVYPSFERHRAEVVILLARQSRASRSVLREMLKRPMPGVLWMAIVNALVSERVPGVAAHLLGDLEFRLAPQVLPRSNMAIGIGGGDGGEPVMPQGIQPMKELEGWPPFAHWQLGDEALAGAVVVSPGRHPIYARRVVTGGMAFCDALSPTRSRHAFRLLALADLSGVPSDALGLEEEDGFTLGWEGEDDYVERVQKRWTLLKLRYGSLVDRLVREGLLTAAEASALRPNVVVDAQWVDLSPRELPEVPEPD